MLNFRKFPLRVMLTAIALLVFATALVLQFTGWRREPTPGRGAHLATAFAVGGPSADLPLGATEVGVRSVLKTLQCDDFIYREYRLPAGTLRLYASYWAPSKMATQLVASHTPDWCWSAAGWTCNEMRFSHVPEFGIKLLPAEWRVFRAPANDQPPQYVLYWHLVGGRPYDYGRSFNFLLNPLKWWRDSVKYAVVGSPEQYFLRLSSEVPIENFHREPVFEALIGALGKLGLAEPAGSAGG